MTTRRGQSNDGGTELPSNIDAILEKRIKEEQTRKAYQQRPDVMEKRKAYQQKQTEERKVARAAMDGNVSALVGMGFSDAQAAEAVAKAASITSA